MTERVTGGESLSVSTSVNGNANITVSGVAVSGDIYGGGYGSDSAFSGGALKVADFSNINVNNGSAEFLDMPRPPRALL